MYDRRGAFIALSLGLALGGCARDTPAGLCSRAEARATITRLAAERVNGVVWLQPPVSETEAKAMTDFTAAAPEPGATEDLVTCKIGFVVETGDKASGQGAVGFTVRKLPGRGGYLFSAENLDPLVKALSIAVGSARARLARPPPEATPLEETPPPSTEPDLEPAPPTAAPPPPPLFEIPEDQPPVPPPLPPRPPATPAG